MPRCLVLLALAVFLAAPARAQFYDLDGTYGCVTAPDAACAKQLDNPPATAQAPLPTKLTPAPPDLGDAIRHVKQRAITPDDIALIERAAADHDPRAVEVLAWCRLNGIGMKPDPVSAFWLYREAAALGVANARENQIAIFETRLTSAQRQEVLLKEDTR